MAEKVGSGSEEVVPEKEAPSPHQQREPVHAIEPTASEKLRETVVVEEAASDQEEDAVFPGNKEPYVLLVFMGRTDVDGQEHITQRGSGCGRCGCRVMHRSRSSYSLEYVSWRIVLHLSSDVIDRTYKQSLLY